jgi:hypothetical protein
MNCPWHKELNSIYKLFLAYRTKKSQPLVVTFFYFGVKWFIVPKKTQVCGCFTLDIIKIIHVYKQLTLNRKL